ncbi:hypothetical protein PT974_11264 [Cladobotryum mycophilum]|uniref:R3H domain-containing protein n=1 Tax=Cladobotryum mycophilum TaxID=491253 RepID=A0ABR0S4R3_9HYPO
MATAHMHADIPKPSFAKVAASVAAEKASAARYKNHTATKMSSNPIEPPAQTALPPQTTNLSVTEKSTVIDKVATSLNHLSLGSNIPSLLVDGAVMARSQAAISRVSGSDDSQKADSSSELGTKPPSLDGKSITSGTTYALDEKESLRPDDSASVKAAAEDDDSSIRGSLIAGSRMGSDLAARVRGIQLGDMPERRLVQQIAGTHGVLTPQSTTSEQPPGMNPPIPLRSAGGSSDALNVIYRQAPDEKLLEALAAPRDRIFLLRLEKDVIDFVQNSK